MLKNVCQLNQFHNVLIVGDFNASSLNWSLDEPGVPSSTDALLLDGVESFGLHQVVYDPTYSKFDEKKNKMFESYLDLLFMLNPGHLKSIEVGVGIDNSDHHSITAVVDITIDRIADVKRTFYNCESR